MIRAKIGTVALLIIACAGGCSVDCEEVCEPKEKSGGPLVEPVNLDPNADPRDLDCANFYEDKTIRAEASGRGSAFNEYLCCLDDQENVCDEVHEGALEEPLFCLYPQQHGSTPARPS